MKTVNWAILAPGKIARDFATALQGVNSANLYSVASRDPGRAKSFAEDFNFETSANSYGALIADPKVDVIYVASPHAFHAEQSIACLKAGKAVLCEKPMTINTAQAQQVFEAAKANNTFYMEAVWTRFMPVFKQVRQWIAEGKIGEVQMLQASLGLAVPFDPTHRLYDAHLAGGALLDVGIYPLTLAQWVMEDQVPVQVMAAGDIGQSHVDERVGMVLKYENGTIATLNTAITTKSSHDAWIFGTKGRIHIPSFWYGEKLCLITDEKEETRTIAHQVNGYEGEIIEVNRCLNEGLLESPLMSWKDSMTLMAIMDDVRDQIGFKYPMEGE